MLYLIVALPMTFVTHSRTGWTSGTSSMTRIPTLLVQLLLTGAITSGTASDWVAAGHSLTIASTINREGHIAEKRVIGM